MKIYTKKGDDGTTQLFGGSRIPKHNIRVECYGTVDELNSTIGLLMAFCPKTIDLSYLNHIQILLFDIGSHLATDPKSEQSIKHLPKIEEEELSLMEANIDEMQAQLKPLTHFILPSGSQSIAQAHICRTVCRRAERWISLLSQEEEVKPLLLQIINRLSDYLFVFARYCAKQEGIKEQLWQPR